MTPTAAPARRLSLSSEFAALATALGAQLATFLGSPQHRAIMTRYGFTDHDVDALPAGQVLM
jgi:hypothetical protein